MFNIAEIFPSQNTIIIFGFTLPHSNTILSKQDIEKKIKSAKKHIAYLTSQLQHRKTHGGKVFRARKISLQDQIYATSKRLDFLKTIKMSILRVQIKEEMPVCSIKIRSMRLEDFKTPWLILS